MFGPAEWNYFNAMFGPMSHNITVIKCLVPWDTYAACAASKAYLLAVKVHLAKQGGLQKIPQDSLRPKESAHL